MGRGVEEWRTSLERWVAKNCLSWYLVAKAIKFSRPMWEIFSVRPEMSRMRVPEASIILSMPWQVLLSPEKPSVWSGVLIIKPKAGFMVP